LTGNLGSKSNSGRGVDNPEDEVEEEVEEEVWILEDKALSLETGGSRRIKADKGFEEE